jgi:hypothetical protein
MHLIYHITIFQVLVPLVIRASVKEIWKIYWIHLEENSPYQFFNKMALSEAMQFNITDLRKP